MMEGTGKRQMSNGGGQSSLGYLFGSGATEEPAAHDAQVLKQQQQVVPLKEQDVNASAPYALKVEDQLKKMLLKDLRSELRAHGLNPAGSKETLLERLHEHFEKTGSGIKSEAFKPTAEPEVERTASNNNYHRPEGQNVGNFLTARRSSKVLAPPGGKSSFSLG